MVAFVASIIITLLGVGVVVVYMRRRPVDAVLTWGEAMVGATFVFFVMFWVYGVVPHQWLTWADNELNWRADKFLWGPANIFQPQSQGGSFPFTITYVVVRDLIAIAIYGVALVANVALWAMWQNRGKAQAEPAVERSSFGRPLVKEGVSA